MTVIQHLHLLFQTTEKLSLCVCMCLYIYIWTCACAHTHTHARFLSPVDMVTFSKVQCLSACWIQEGSVLL